MVRVDWEKVPQVRRNQVWKHKRHGTLWRVGRKVPNGYFMVRMTGGSIQHHTREKDIHVHYYLVS